VGLVLSDVSIDMSRIAQIRVRFSVRIAQPNESGRI
jgi:hypothetical protein